MSKVVEWFLLPLFFLLSVVYAFNSLCTEPIHLKKVYYHSAADDTYLERGNVSLYFSHEPCIKKIKEDSFFFPCSIASEECDSMIQRLNSMCSNAGIAIEKMTDPEKGILITLQHDPLKTALSYELFDSIGMQKGVVFRLYNKDVVNALQHKSNQPILRMLSTTQKPCIVIDPGHGGKDSGAIGDGSVMEKAVCLAIGKDVADLLAQRGCSVLLTRQKDKDMSLDQRTLFANEQHADLFVSIHANYAANSGAQGVETFCVQPHLFNEYFSTLSQSEKKNIAQHIQKKSDISRNLAESIQRYVCCKHYVHEKVSHKPVDRKVKFSVSQVLLGAQMPSVLVELGFLSHPEEVVLLHNKRYQKFLAQRIVDGVLAVLSV